ncbi:hypothetical protein BDW59DRAFT_154699 [Aspergillus cavernicola]|uniref:Uncharacterized protein n=1 Tax=Aspergillus cavernicola TaxID=176166 RepID=A0ABR4HDY5_9EURO
MVTATATALTMIIAPLWILVYPSSLVLRLAAIFNFPLFLPALVLLRVERKATRL